MRVQVLRDESLGFRVQVSSTQAVSEIGAEVIRGSREECARSQGHISDSLNSNINPKPISDCHCRFCLATVFPVVQVW